MTDEQGVELAARRVPLAHVESLEVMPVGLHFWALGNGEAETNENIFEFLPGLCDEMQMTSGCSIHRLGEVESLPCHLRRTFDGNEFLAAFINGSTHRCEALV